MTLRCLVVLVLYSYSVLMVSTEETDEQSSDSEEGKYYHTVIYNFETGIDGLGNLVSTKNVLTVASILRKGGRPTPLKSLVVRYGSPYYAEGGYLAKPRNVTFHPKVDYKSEFIVWGKDIALITLTSDVIGETFQLIPIHDFLPVDELKEIMPDCYMKNWEKSALGSKKPISTFKLDMTPLKKTVNYFKTNMEATPVIECEDTGLAASDPGSNLGAGMICSGKLISVLHEFIVGHHDALKFDRVDIEKDFVRCTASFDGADLDDKVDGIGRPTSSSSSSNDSSVSQAAAMYSRSNFAVSTYFTLLSVVYLI